MSHNSVSVLREMLKNFEGQLEQKYEQVTRLTEEIAIVQTHVEKIQAKVLACKEALAALGSPP